MSQWSLGMSSESSQRGGEHVTLLSLPAHSAHPSRGLSYHTTCCWRVCQWPRTNLTNCWCPEFIGSQIHQNHSSSELISVLLNLCCPPPSLPPWCLFIFIVLKNKSNVIPLWNSSPPSRKSLFPSSGSCLRCITSESVTFEQFQYSSCLWHWDDVTW